MPATAAAPSPACLLYTSAKAVRAHDFIMEMEKGYYTEVNERGSRLSQGQKQLIAFARTLLSDPKILILEEACLLYTSRCV